MDLGRTDLALEAARVPVWVALLCRGVGQPATGTAETLYRPNAVCHSRIVRHTERLRQQGGYSR